MKIKILPLLLWVFIFLILNGPIKSWVQSIHFEEEFKPFFSDWGDILYFISFLTAFGTLSILVYLSFYYFFPKRKTLQLIGGIAASILTGIFLRFLIEEKIYFWLFNQKNYRGDYTLAYYVSDNIFFVAPYIILGIVYYFYQSSKFNEQQKIALEIENKDAELAFLKSQVNPHFLFNSLNNLYSLIYHKSDKALPAVEKLSSLLRYSLYETKNQIDLQKELNYIQNFIELEQLRHDYPLEIHLEIDKKLSPTSIAPFILIPFIENIFKHGTLNNSDEPVIITIKNDASELSLYCQNEIKEQEKDEIGGIGLENIKKRLALIYPEKHQLHINERDGIFTVDLKIQH